MVPPKAVIKNIPQGNEGDIFELLPEAHAFPGKECADKSLQFSREAVN